MDIIYILFFLTVLIFPLLALGISVNIQRGKFLEIIKPVIAFFLIHNFFFLLGFSIRGDYIDYFIFSLEYFFCCLTIFGLFKFKSVYVKVIGVLGTIVISIIFIIGIPGMFVFLMISDSYITDKVFYFESNNNSYETRRYSFGSATLDNTKYTFDTYQYYSFLPFENKVDESIFYDTETNIEIDEGDLRINIETRGDKKKIFFRDYKGNIFSKTLN